MNDTESTPPAPTAQTVAHEINQKYSAIAAEQGDLQFLMFDLKDQQKQLIEQMAKIEARQSQLRHLRDDLQAQLRALPTSAPKEHRDV